MYGTLCSLTATPVHMKQLHTSPCPGHFEEHGRKDQFVCLRHERVGISTQQAAHDRTRQHSDCLAAGYSDGMCQSSVVSCTSTVEQAHPFGG